MRYFEVTTSLSAPSTVGAMLSALVSRAWEAYIQRRNRRVARRELAALNDRMLRDIGISRGEIEFVVRGHQAGRRGK